jgi:hypothetical protein
VGFQARDRSRSVLLAKADDSIGRLFDWYNAGDVEFETATSGITFHLTAASRFPAGVDLGSGRDRLWPHSLRLYRRLGRRHAMDAPVVVVTHRVPTG